MTTTTTATTTTTTTTTRVEIMHERWLPSLLALFEACASTCFCRYWHFTGTKNEWLDRCAHRPEENAAELEAAVRSNDPTGQGLIAIDTSSGPDANLIIGWMKLTARANVPKLRSLPVYRSLNLGDETTTLSIACMLVHPNYRMKGVARALAEAAPKLAFEMQASSLGSITPITPIAIEAYPRHSDVPLYPEEAWLGPERAFAAAGFEVAHNTPPYPVYRRRL